MESCPSLPPPNPHDTSSRRFRARRTSRLAGRIARRSSFDVAPFVPCDLRKKALARYRARLFLRNVFRGCILIAMFDEEPCGSIGIAPKAPGVNQDPRALEFLAVKR